MCVEPSLSPTSPLFPDGLWCTVFFSYGTACEGIAQGGLDRSSGPKHLNVNERRVYRMAGKADWLAFEVGDTWRFGLEDIDASSKQQQGPRGADFAMGPRGKRSKGK